MKPPNNFIASDANRESNKNFIDVLNAKCKFFVRGARGWYMGARGGRGRGMLLWRGGLGEEGEVSLEKFWRDWRRLGLNVERLMLKPNGQL